MSFTYILSLGQKVNGHQCFYASLDLKQNGWLSSPFTYIISNPTKNVKFFFKVFLFFFKVHREILWELPAASSVVFLYFTFICFRSWSHLLSSCFQYFLSSSSVSNRSSGCTDFHDTTCWVSSLRDSNWCRLYPHHDPTVSSTCGIFVTVPPLCRYSSTVSFRIFMFTCSWYG